MQDRLKELLADIKDEALINRKRFASVMLIIVLIIAAVIMKISQKSQNEITIDNETDQNETLEIYVDICGEVYAPGVYQVESGTRLYEVIELAGGLTEDANTDIINRAEYVEDGQKITIPSYEDTENGDSGSGSVSGVTGVSSNGLININYADKEQLKSITGVGDVIADRIIEYREKTKFKTVEDIMCVQGIGNKTYEKMKDEITV